MKLNRISLLRVHYMPRQFEPGILYVSEEYGTAMHLCACGCGLKVTTPILPSRWSFKDTPHGPSLWPSVGNWTQPCNSHYVIDDGDIVWCESWSPEAVMAGREREKAKRDAHYKGLYAPWYRRLWNWLKGLFAR